MVEMHHLAIEPDRNQVKQAPKDVHLHLEAKVEVEVDNW